MRRPAILCSIVSIVAVIGCSSEAERTTGYVVGEELSGGATTTLDAGQNAFNHPAANLDDREQTLFAVGNSFFKQNWVAAPSSTAGRDGLGPLFNARSCSGCHIRDGRGRPPVDSEEISGLLFRLSAADGRSPHAIYGDQFQPHAIQGLRGEGRVTMSYTDVVGTFADGTPYTLQRPAYHFEGNYGPLDDALVSPRVAQQICGMGLLEAITEADITANTRVTVDGITGRMNRVPDIRSGTLALGRFGWKANEPTVAQQMASAFNGDIGITSALFPIDHSTPAQGECRKAINGNSDGDTVELNAITFDRVAFYASTVAVPARRNAAAPEVVRGKDVFDRIGCTGCHRPSYITGESTTSPALSRQAIHPYTDLLLHDMGEALEDGRPDGLATGREWRTPPLWGVGLFQAANGHTRYLHDGRAHDLNEAVLWHGGEAAPAQERYRALTAAERAALLAFLNSL